MHLMKLRTFTDYSLRVLLYVARAPEGRATICEIARAYGISEHHLVKVVHFLGRHGLLSNTRGRRGGLRLGRPASEINLAGVVRLTEAGDTPAECFDRASNTCVVAGGCELQRALREALGKFYQTLECYTLADLHVHSSKRPSSSLSPSAA
jgi:Rrf2 family transcriptional regulator, nitric oxide-sensitive transcriptional repressor